MLASKARLLEFLKQKSETLPHGLSVYYELPSFDTPLLRISYLINIPLRELCEGFPRVKKVTNQTPADARQSLSDEVRSFEHVLRSLEDDKVVFHSVYRLKGNKQQRAVSFEGPFNPAPTTEFLPDSTLLLDPDAAALLQALQLTDLPYIAMMRVADMVPSQLMTIIIQQVLLKAIFASQFPPGGSPVATSTPVPLSQEMVEAASELVTESLSLIAFTALCDKRMSLYTNINTRGTLNRCSVMSFLCWLHYFLRYVRLKPLKTPAELRERLLTLLQHWFSPGKVGCFATYQMMSEHIEAVVKILQRLQIDRFDDALDHSDRLTPQEIEFFTDSPLSKERYRKNRQRHGTYYCSHCGKAAFSRSCQTVCLESRLPTFSKAIEEHEPVVGPQGELLCPHTHQFIGCKRSEPEFQYQIYSRFLKFVKEAKQPVKKSVPSNNLFTLNFKFAPSNDDTKADSETAAPPSPETRKKRNRDTDGRKSAGSEAKPASKRRILSASVNDDYDDEEGEPFFPTQTLDPMPVLMAGGPQPPLQAPYSYLGIVDPETQFGNNNVGVSVMYPYAFVGPITTPELVQFPLPPDTAASSAALLPAYAFPPFHQHRLAPAGMPMPFLTDPAASGVPSEFTGAQFGVAPEDFLPNPSADPSHPLFDTKK